MVPDVLPPHRLLTTKPISLSTASTILTTYVSNSELHAHLHPDALITASGVVTFSSNGGPTGGVVMHNLRRVAAGLRGEYLEPEPTPEPEQEAAAQEDKDAQDQSEYEREEGGITVGEIGERSNFVQSGGDAPAVEATGEETAAGASGEKRKASAKDDKEARKRAKKEREAEFKKKKAAEKKKKAEEEE